jgi:hypothetical protein
MPGGSPACTLVTVTVEHSSAASNQEPRRFVSLVETAYPLGMDHTGLRLLDGTVIAVPAAWGPAAFGCYGIRTLDEHERTLESDGRPYVAQDPNRREALKGLVAAGALASYDDLLSRHRVAQEAESPPRITTLVVPTRDRPALLERCIRSFVGNTRSHDRRLDVVVGDDSEDRFARVRLRDRLRLLARNEDFVLRYAGAEEKEDYARALAEVSGVPYEVVAYGLLGSELGSEEETERMGANRNALLLDGVGELCVSVDDDTVCQLTPHPHMTGGIYFLENEDPTEFWFYEGRASSLAAVPFVLADYFAQHERLLGRSVGSVLATAGASVTRAGPYVGRALTTGSGRVAVTFNGVVGDSGMFSGVNLLESDGGTRERLLRSEGTYRSAFASREVLRVAPALTVCGDRPFMGTFFGFDARGPLPPFLPTRRNEDGVFGHTLQRCFPSDCFGHVPYASLHAPSGVRTYEYDRFSEIRVVRLSTLVTECLRSAWLPEPHLDWRVAMDIIGRGLQDIASLPLPAFDRFVRDLICKRDNRRANYYEQLLSLNDGSPRFWADDVRARIRALPECITSEAYFIPVDVKGSSMAARRERTRTLMASWGRLLSAWPRLLDAARDLKASGRRVSRAL